MDSCKNVKEAIELGKQLVELFDKAGMQLGKIISNNQEVLAAFPPHMRAESIDVAEFCTDDLDSPVVKTLGMVYLSQEDAFSYDANLPKHTKWTKRTILQHKAKLYDPHGLISPHTIISGIILQRLWRQGKDWDQEISEEESKQWADWLASSKELPTLRIPRCLDAAEEGRSEVHFFCDASADAYAAAAYYVTEQEAYLVVSKARVAPLKAISIPRLELLGAELIIELVKLVSTATKVHRKNFWYWTDSTNVLSWVHTDSRSLQEFVGNRVAKITEETELSHWRWVPTKQNPADLPSRGVPASKVSDAKIWWKGPDFLISKNWPEQPKSLQMPEEASLEVKKGMAFNTKSSISLEDNYRVHRDCWSHLTTSNWRRTCRALAWCRRWRRPKKERSRPLSPEEEAWGEKVMLKTMQQTALAKSRGALEEGTTLSPSSPLIKVDPFIDQDGIMRVGGRLAQMKYLPFESRHQIIVPKDHPWTAALITSVHRKLCHQGAAHVAAQLRQKYWIIRATQKIRSVTTSCGWCKRQRARQIPQRMAPTVEDRLPEERCTPFTYTAVDAAGPYYIKDSTSKQTEKAYFILFTCCTVRAVHLEAVFKLTTNAFLAALDRFTARRGVPKQMRSDNGSNFTAAYSELSKLWTREAVDEYQTKRSEIKWIFNPPKAPYFGGIFERMVGSVKRALFHVAKSNVAPTKEAFITMVTMVEGIMNSRPLTLISPDADAPESITPSHFLGTSPYRPLANLHGKQWTSRTAWKAMQASMDKLWQRFCSEMRSTLQSASKWHSERPDLRPEDIVVVLENKERGVWPLGKVIRVEPSRDGLVRKVQVMFRGHTVRRAVNGLFLLAQGSEPTAAGQVHQVHGHVEGRQEGRQEVDVEHDLPPKTN